MTTSGLLLALSQLIERRYPGRVSVAVLPITEDPPGVRVHEMQVRQTAKNSRRKLVMFIIGDELPRTLTIRYEPHSKRVSVPIDEEGFTVNGRALTMEGFVRHVFMGWFGGYQVY